jgi:thymidylate synthase (FAD)
MEHENRNKEIIHPLISVLDHGFVRLVDSMGDDLSIVRSARVSYDADWRAGDENKDDKLISYLLRNTHTSPFESVVFTFEIKCPIFVARQWHRHRTWSYNEVSARYTELPEEYYMPKEESLTKQSTDNKQGRSEDPIKDRRFCYESLENHSIQAFEAYKYYLQCGMARELARMVLPLNTYTRFFGTVNLHNLLHNFLPLRLDHHAQYEIRVYAEAIQDIIKEIVPVTMRHWGELES